MHLPRFRIQKELLPMNTKTMFGGRLFFEEQSYMPQTLKQQYK